MCRGRSVTYVLALAWVPKCVLELWLAHYKNFKPKVCITGASSVINVDSYDEAALEETKLAKRDCQSSKDAWTSSWYGCGCRPFARASLIGGHFNFVFKIFFPIHQCFPLHGKCQNKFLQTLHSRHIILTAVIVYNHLLFEIRISNKYCDLQMKIRTLTIKLSERTIAGRLKLLYTILKPQVYNSIDLL